MPATRIADERAGVDMLYSSVTTVRPQGVRVPLPEEPAIAAPNTMVMLAAAAFGIGPDSLYLSPAPLSHAAPLRWTTPTHRLRGTVETGSGSGRERVCTSRCVSGVCGSFKKTI